jgi:uncharacterized protein DUF1707
MCRRRGWGDPAAWHPTDAAPPLPVDAHVPTDGPVPGDAPTLVGATPANARAAGDDDREAASSELRTHFTEGRLDVDEFSSRLDEVWQSETTADLDTALRQLPPISGRPRPWARPEIAPAQTGWVSPTRPAPAAARRHRPVWVNVVFAIVAVWVAIALWPVWLIAVAAWLLVRHHRRRQDRYDAWYGWYA